MGKGVSQIRKSTKAMTLTRGEGWFDDSLGFFFGGPENGCRVSPDTFGGRLTTLRTRGLFVIPAGFVSVEIPWDSRKPVQR
jgi:hypothetical protein